MTKNTVKYIWFVVKCLIFHSVLIRKGVVAQPVQGLYSKECLHAASCWMSHGDLRRALNMNYDEFYNESRNFIQRHQEFVKGGEVEINTKCATETTNCQGQLISDAYILGPTKPPGLIHSCPADTLNYMFLLCSSQKPGYWPQDIYDEIIPNHPTCGIACDQMMMAYHAYHLANGKNFPQDFPKSWESRLEEEKEKITSLTTNTLGRRAEAEQNSQSELARNAYIYMEVGNKFLADEGSQAEKLTGIECRRGTWVTSVKDELPNLIFGYCNGPKHSTDQSNNFIDKTTSSVLEAEANGSPRGAWVHCMNAEKVLANIPGAFSFVTGVQFKVLGNGQIGVGNWLCGGWSDWGGYSNGGGGGGQESNELTCPHLTAMCSIEYASLKASGGAARTITYVKIGCCEIPWNIYYSATNFKIGEITNNRAYTSWVSTRKNLAHSGGHTEHPYPSKGKLSHFCPPGEFIFGVSTKPITDAFRKLIFYREIVIHERIDFYGYFSYPIHRTDFYCKALAPKSSVSMIDDIYHRLNLIDNEAEFTPPPPENSCSSYAIGIDSDHLCFRDERGRRMLRSRYTMHCSDGRKTQRQEIQMELHEKVFEKTDQAEHKTNFDCPKKYALCGLQTFVEQRSLETQRYNREPILLFQGLSDKAITLQKRPFSDIFETPLQGLFMNYVCCPIPVLIVGQSCPEGVEYDIREDEQKLKACKEGVSSCSFGEIFGYTIKNETQVITDQYIGPHYPDYDNQIAAAISRATRKFLGSGFEKYLTLNQYTEPDLGEEGADLQQSSRSGPQARQSATGNDKFFGKFMQKFGKLGLFARDFKDMAALPGIVIGIFNSLFGEEASDPQLEAQLEANRILADISGQLAKMQSALVTTKAHHYSNISTRTFEVGKGSGFVFYNMVLTCGDYSITSDHNIEYITHSPDCEHRTEDQFKWQDIHFKASTDDLNFTKVFSGFGISIAGVSNENSIENVLPWHTLTRNETLRNNLIRAGTKTTHFSLARAPRELFERANFTKKYLVSFVVPKNHLAALYRVEILCRPWTVKTNDFYLRVGPVGSDFSEFDQPRTAGWTKYPPEGPLPVEPSPKN